MRIGAVATMALHTLRGGAALPGLATPRRTAAGLSTGPWKSEVVETPCELNPPITWMPRRRPSA